MKKISWATHKTLFGQIASSACLIGASAGVIFGVSAGTFKIKYFDLNNINARVAAYNSISNNYSSQNITSQWNMNEKLGNNGKVAIKGVDQPKTNTVEEEWWKDVHHTTQLLSNDDETREIYPSLMKLDTTQGTSIDPETQAERYKYSTLIIDGSTHSAMDRSFNQGLLNGLANFNTNVIHDITDEKEVEFLKPAQDTTQEFINIYRASAAKTAVLALAGFNHVTPINALGKQGSDGTFNYADDVIKKTGLMLMDGDVANNQNVASVLFRSDQPAFLTALSTCMYFYNNLDIYHEGFKDLSVGGYGGTAIPTVTVYLGGFQRGIEFFNEFILKQVFLDGFARYYMNNMSGSEHSFFVDTMLRHSKYKDEVQNIKDMPEEAEEKQQAIEDVIERLYDEFSIKMIKLGNFGTHFSGSFAAGDAIGISKQLLNRGASAIIAVAGPQSLDTAQEIMNQNKSCIVIGVDSAMERSDYQKPFKNPSFKDKGVDNKGNHSAQASNIIKFSAVKDMTTVSDKILRLAATGKNYDVATKENWLTNIPTPTVSSSEITPISGLKIKPNGDNTFDIEGFADGYNNTCKCLVLPTTYTKDGKTYSLNKISGFSDTGLNSVEIIKIQGVPTNTISFGANAFTFNANASKLRHIDFKSVPTDKIEIGETGHVFKNIQYTGEKIENNNLGYIKLGDGTSTDQGKLYTYLLGDEAANYIHAEADPYKSICSFGYKTCGNIENGLISISWDGWAPLIECLQYLSMYENSSCSGDPSSFITLWEKYAKEYVQEATAKSIKLPDGYSSAVCVSQIEKLITYDSASPINKGYNHTMNILGNLLANSYLKFGKNMTVVVDKNGVAHEPEDSQSMTILEWLKTNMYFTI